MKMFLREDREKFIEYALRDVLISLIHSLWMEDFNLGVGGIGVPLSLSSIRRKYVKQIWKETNYTGYQLSNFTNLFSWRCSLRGLVQYYIILY